MAGDGELVRPATPAELADVASMHAANRAAWDEAAERYEGWLDEAVALIRSGGTNLLESSENLVDWTTVGSSVDPYLPFCDFSIESPPAMFFRVRKEY